MSEGNGNGSRAHAFLERVRKEIILKEADGSDGPPATIRKIDVTDLVSTGVLPPAVVFGDKTPEEAAREVKTLILQGQNVAKERAAKVALIGCVNPVLHDGSAQTCPDGQVPVDDMSTYLRQLYDEILTFSGYEELLIKGAAFRGRAGVGELGLPVGEGERADTDASAPDASGRVRRGGGTSRRKRSGAHAQAP